MPDPSEINKTVRLYWVEESKMNSGDECFGYSFDYRNQIKVYRENFTDVNSAESQYSFKSVSTISKVCAKVMVNRGEIYM